MTTLTPERIAQIRAQNAARATTDWPTRYLVDELLDALEAQAQEIARFQSFSRLTEYQYGYWDDKGWYCVFCENEIIPGVDATDMSEIEEGYHDAECPWLAARAALREAVPDA